MTEEVVVEYHFDVKILSVTAKILTCPVGGKLCRRRLIWTFILSLEAQCLMYTEYCIIVNPSFSNALRNRVALRRSTFVFVGKSNITNNHIILYALSRISCIYLNIGQLITFCSFTKHLAKEAVVNDKAMLNGRFILPNNVSENKTLSNFIFVSLFN